MPSRQKGHKGCVSLADSKTSNHLKSRRRLTAYQDFFALWKDADPDIPILKEAKTEYPKLQ